MGGLAGAAGTGRLNEPVWLVGGDADLGVAGNGPVVWLVSLDEPAVRDRAGRVRLPPAALAEVAGSGHAGERLLRRRLAMLLLAAVGRCRVDEVEIVFEPDRPPRVAAPAGWHLALAARWPDCAIAVAREPLGVDVERVTEEPVPLDLLTPAEREQFQALPAADQRAAFAACWAAKEAHAKWTGQPRRLDPAAIETAAAPLVTSALGRTRCWHRRDGVLAAALCTRA